MCVEESVCKNKNPAYYIRENENRADHQHGVCYTLAMRKLHRRTLDSVRYYDKPEIIAEVERLATKYGS